MARWPLRLLLCGAAVAMTLHSASAQPSERNPSPEAYVQRVGGGATLVQSGQLVLDGHHLTCRGSPTVLDPNLNDYAA